MGKSGALRGYAEDRAGKVQHQPQLSTLGQLTAFVLSSGRLVCAERRGEVFTGYHVPTNKKCVAVLSFYFGLGTAVALATCQKAERNQVIKILKPVKKKKIKTLDVLLLFTCDRRTFMKAIPRTSAVAPAMPGVLNHADLVHEVEVSVIAKA